MRIDQGSPKHQTGDPENTETLGLQPKFKDHVVTALKDVNLQMPELRGEGPGNKSLHSRRLSEATSGYGTDSDLSDDDSNFSSKDEAFVHDYCKRADVFLEAPGDKSVSSTEEPVIWLDSFAKRLKDISLRQRRPVTMEDYFQLLEDNNVDLMLSVPKVYHPDEIKERIKVINLGGVLN